VSVDRKKRLAKLVVLQQQLKAFHETLRSGHIAAANAAEQEAQQLAGRLDDPDSLSALFPQLYHNRIASAFARRDESLSKAADEARRLTAASLRANMVEEAYRGVARKVDEHAADKERLEIVERKLTGK
jgi:ABC-type transporter Mla subunit MlaD